MFIKIVDLFEDKKAQTTVYHISDTPRSLLIKGAYERVITQAHTVKTAKLVIEEVKKTRDKEVYNQVAKYIPSNTLIGRSDEIPGVRDIFGKYQCLIIFRC